MNSKDFETVIEEQIDKCKEVLIGKAKEYAQDDDRLHNFKNAAGMMGCDPKEALAGMMAKHTISVYDMCRDGGRHNLDLWNEKITDHINYLLLLKAIVMEEKTSISYRRHFFDAPEIKTVEPGDKVEFDCGLTDPTKDINKGLSDLVNDWDELLRKEADKSTKEWPKKVADGLGLCSGPEIECDKCVFQKNHDCSYALLKAAKNLIETHILDSEEKND